MKKVLRWLGLTLGVVVVLLAIAVGFMYVRSGQRLARTYEAASSGLVAPADSASLSEGSRLAVVWGCADCHTADFGGEMFIDAPPFGRIPAPNLTAGVGGVGGAYDDEDWARAVRHGIKPDGTPLLIMPSTHYSGLSNEDLGRIVAHLRSTAPIDREHPARTLGPIGRMLVATGLLPVPADAIDHERSEYTAPPRAATVEYGAYLGSGCSGCHGEDLTGGPALEPDTPAPPNLTPHLTDGIGSWRVDDLRRALREGRRPDGTVLALQMPWPGLARLEDDEIEAIWLYLSSVPALPDPTG